MNERNYKRKYEFSQRVISRQLEQIESLKTQNEKLLLECQKKDEVINSFGSLRNDLTKEIENVKQYKEQYEELVKELRDMKTIFNKELYKGKWSLVKLLIK